MSDGIYLDAPSVGELEKEYINKAIDNGFVSTAGPYVPEFEQRVALYLGVKKAVSTQSGTAAIHVALYEFGIGPGHEVIVPALTFVAAVNPITYVGARPVFADVDEKTWNIAPEEIEKNITKRTKAIIPVHFYGNPCDMGAIMKIARKYNLKVIEDATESLGARFRNKHTGTFGDLGCFSFNGNKIITTGGGGMVAGRNIKRMGHIKFLVNQAKSQRFGYYHPEVGFNYRMTNVEAALGLAQMERLEKFLLKKKEIIRIYKEELSGIKFIHFQEECKGAKSSWWLSAIKFEEEIDISALQERLKGKGVPTRRIFMPVVDFPPYKKERQRGFRNSYKIHKTGLCLPSSTLNSDEQIYRACSVLKRLIKGK